jgi:hypothetical protein
VTKLLLFLSIPSGAIQADRVAATGRKSKHGMFMKAALYRNFPELKEGKIEH